MITREEADRLRQTLLEALAEDAHNTQRLLARLDALAHESGLGTHAALLLILTHLGFDEPEARRHWERIVETQKTLRDALGRDPGVRVAVLDYFANVNRQLLQPTLIDIEMLDAERGEATRDELTGLSSDRMFRTALQHELRRARRYDQHAAVVLFDLDDFGAVNRRFGEFVADRVLREAAILLSNKIRDIDVAARPGEDEFALLLPETDRNGALLVAERVRRELSAYFAGRQSGDEAIGMTVSAGVACYPEDAASPDVLLERAAQALYQAKAYGKNDVRLYHPERRRFLRFELEPGRFEIEVLVLPSPTTAAPRNLSRNGILFASPEPLEIGDAIEIRLADAGEAEARSLRIRGDVVRVEQLPSLHAGEAPHGADSTRDGFEIGVAFDLEWGEGTDDLLDFLERAQRRGVDNVP